MAICLDGNLGVFLERVCHASGYFGGIFGTGVSCLGVIWGYFGTGVCIYMAFDKYDLFIYLIVRNVDVIICCLLSLYNSACSVCCLYAKFQTNKFCFSYFSFFFEQVIIILFLTFHCVCLLVRLVLRQFRNQYMTVDER